MPGHEPSSSREAGGDTAARKRVPGRGRYAPRDASNPSGLRLTLTAAASPVPWRELWDRLLAPGPGGIDPVLEDGASAAENAVEQRPVGADGSECGPNRITESAGRTPGRGGRARPGN